MSTETNKAAMANHLIEQYQTRVARLRGITPEDLTLEGDRNYDLGRKHRREEMQPLIEDLVGALNAIDHLSCNAPCMSCAVQSHFERNSAADAYRVELNGLILEMREKARSAIAKAKTP